MMKSDANGMGMFRFGVISPLLSESDAPLRSRFERIASEVRTLPNGTLRQFSVATVEDWYYDYRKYGFEGLVNPARSDKGCIRAVSPEIMEAVDEILKDHPRLKGTNVIRRLDERGLRPGGEPSDSSIYRYLRTARPQFLEVKVKERKAFEAPFIGYLYQTDIMYGPHVMVRQENGRYHKKQTYLIAVIDDYSRLICHGEFFISQGLMEYLCVLEQSILKRGIPERIYCDNGKVFLSDQVKRIGAEIGMRVIHTKVRDAAAKGKIERWFQTVRSQFLENHETVHQLSKLNAAFFKWVETYNQSKHSGIGCSPMEKWLNSPRSPRILTDAFNTDDIFWLEVTRVVRKDGTFSLNCVRYETNYTLAGKKVTIRYNSQNTSGVRVYHDDSFISLSYPLDATANNNLPRTGK